MFALDDEAVDPAIRAATASRSTWVSVVVNTALSAAQVVVGVISGSAGLIADGIHSLSDLVADFLVLFVARHSQAEADDRHPYGHFRFETAASLALGVLLAAVGIGMLWNAVLKIEHLDAIPRVEASALYVAGVALIAKEALFRYMLAAAKRVKSGMLVANAWHARSDAASSLVVGVGIAGNLLGYSFLDPVAALVVGGMVLKMGWDFGWEALHDLMDQSADEAEVAAIDTTIRAVPGVVGCHNLRTRKLGDMLMVDVHVDVAAALSVAEGHAIVQEVEDRVRARHRVLGMMTHVDPWPMSERH
ncbi:MAG: cation diffusion facilitator family transporter [Sphingomonadales bacterium]|nr:cation diffusion facilitator family transporter [Sphingomonadales bacterium]